MLNIILFDAVEVRENLMPMTFTRPVADLRVGILTIREKWERVLDGSYSYLTVDYLQEKFPVNEAEENLFVAGNICPTTELVAKIKMLNVGDVLISSQGEIIAFRGGLKDFSSRNFAREIECYDDCLTIKMLYDIFMENHRGIVEDFALLTHGRASQSLSDTNTVIGNLSNQVKNLQNAINGYSTKIMPLLQKIYENCI